MTFEAWVLGKLTEVRALRRLQPLWREQCAREEDILVELLRGFGGDFARGVHELLARHLNRSALAEEALFLARLAAFQSSHADAPAPAGVPGGTIAQLTWDLEQGSISPQIIAAAAQVGPHTPAADVAAGKASGAPPRGGASGAAPGVDAIVPEELHGLIPFVREALRRRNWEREAASRGLPPERVRSVAGCVRLLLDAYDRLRDADPAQESDDATQP